MDDTDFDPNEEPPDLPGPLEPADPGGRPPFVPSEEQRLMVQILVSNGISQATIARNIHRVRGDHGIDLKTLRKVFRHELDYGYADTEARMGASVVREGLKGNVMAARYWLQTHAGDEWKTTENVRHGLTADTPRDAFQGRPTLIIQPVRMVDYSQQGPLIPADHMPKDVEYQDSDSEPDNS